MQTRPHTCREALQMLLTAVQNPRDIDPLTTFVCVEKAKATLAAPDDAGAATAHEAMHIQAVELATVLRETLDLLTAYRGDRLPVRNPHVNRTIELARTALVRAANL